jgi:hypothetical protein
MFDKVASNFVDLDNPAEVEQLRRFYGGEATKTRAQQAIDEARRMEAATKVASKLREQSEKNLSSVAADTESQERTGNAGGSSGVKNRLMRSVQNSEKMEIAKSALKLAEALEAGQVQHLTGIKTQGDVAKFRELLREHQKSSATRVEVPSFPFPILDRDDFSQIRQQLPKDLAAKVFDLEGRTFFNGFAEIRNESDIKTLREVSPLLGEGSRAVVEKMLKDYDDAKSLDPRTFSRGNIEGLSAADNATFPPVDRRGDPIDESTTTSASMGWLKRMGITDADQYRAALREFASLAIEPQFSEPEK